MWGLACYGSGRNWATVLLLSAAALFHWTAGLMLVFMTFLAWRGTPPRWAPVAVAVVFAAGATLTAEIMPGLRISALTPASGALFRAVPTAAALVTLAILRRRLKVDARQSRTAAALEGIAVFSLVLLPVSSMIADRVGYYAVPFQIWVFTNVIVTLVPTLKRRAAYAAVATVSILLFVGWLVLSPYREYMVPYDSYLLHPTLMKAGASPEPYRE